MWTTILSFIFPLLNKAKGFIAKNKFAVAAVVLIFILFNLPAIVSTSFYFVRLTLHMSVKLKPSSQSDRRKNINKT